VQKPYVLNSELALQEAKSSVANGQVWVCFTRTPDSTAPTLACVVAATRDYAPVTAITKVYTNSAFRGRGYAKRLVRYVTEQYVPSSVNGHTGLTVHVASF
jgi:predicted GNAT family acetyltransferase